jgi:hypothetical protein
MVYVIAVMHAGPIAEIKHPVSVQGVIKCQLVCRNTVQRNGGRLDCKAVSDIIARANRIGVVSVNTVKIPISSDGIKFISEIIAGIDKGEVEISTAGIIAKTAKIGFCGQVWGDVGVNLQPDFVIDLVYRGKLPAANFEMNAKHAQ